MANYEAVVRIEFSDEDLDDFNDDRYVLDPYEALTASLDNLPLGVSWIEQIFRDGRPTITILPDV